MRPCIWWVVVSSPVSATCSRAFGPGSPIAADEPAYARASEESFVSLFDGVSLAGWQGHVEDYEAADGILVCKEGARVGLQHSATCVPIHAVLLV